MFWWRKKKEKKWSLTIWRPKFESEFVELHAEREERLREERARAQRELENRLRREASEREQRLRQEMIDRESRIKAEFERQKQEQTANACIQRLQDLMNTRKNIIEWQLMPQSQVIEGIIAQYRSIKLAVLQKFGEEHDDKGIFKIVALGKTGAGKSTFCNIVANDQLFVTGDSSDSCTTTISKHIVTIQCVDGSDDAQTKSDHNEGNNRQNCVQQIKAALIDTPGALDTKGRDQEFATELVQYLRGSGGIHCFLVFFDYQSKRFDPSFVTMLSQLTQMLGPKFWRHVIIICTKVDDEEELELFIKHKEENAKKIIEQCQLQNTLFDKMQLPMIPFSKKWRKQKSDLKNECNKRILELLRSLSELHEPYMCDCLKSPLDEYEQQLTQHIDKYQQTVSTWTYVAREITKTSELLCASGCGMTVPQDEYNDWKPPKFASHQ